MGPSIAELSDDTADEGAILLLLPTGRDAELAECLLKQAQAPCRVCTGFTDMMERMQAGSGPVVIAAEALHPGHVPKVTEVLEEQPAWSDLPIILVVEFTGPPRALESLVLRPAVTLLHRPLKTATFVTLAQSALQSRRRQHQLRNALSQLQDRANQLQTLALELSQAEERERQKLALLLHDDLQQILAAALLRINLLPKEIQAGNTRPATQQLSEMLREAIEKSRNLSHELAPPTLQQLGVVSSLEWLAQRMERMHALAVQFHADPDAEPKNLPLKTFLYRTAQEFLFNVVKHAGTSCANLAVERSGTNIVLTVSDNGNGFDVDRYRSNNGDRGWGLFSIEERVELLNGKLEIQSQPGRGSTLSLTIPEGLSLHNGQAEHRPETGVENSQLSRETPVPNEKLRVMLVDDHMVMRHGLSATLANEDDIEVVAEAGNGIEAIELADELQPDLILMDIAMPKMDGIEATKRIKERHPDTRIIALSMLDDRETTNRIIEAGAEQHLSKAHGTDKLLRAVRETQ